GTSGGFWARSGVRREVLGVHRLRGDPAPRGHRGRTRLNQGGSSGPGERSSARPSPWLLTISGPRHAEGPASPSMRAGAGTLEGRWAEIVACPARRTGVTFTRWRRERVLLTPRIRCLSCADCSA